jgi:hypothetical protein
MRFVQIGSLSPRQAFYKTGLHAGERLVPATSGSAIPLHKSPRHLSETIELFVV